MDVQDEPTNNASLAMAIAETGLRPLQDVRNASFQITTTSIEPPHPRALDDSPSILLLNSSIFVESMARTSSARKPYEVCSPFAIVKVVVLNALLYQRPSSRTTEGLWVHDKAPGVPSAVLNTASRPTGAIIDTKLVVSNLHYNITIKDLVVCLPLLVCEFRLMTNIFM